MERPFFSLSKRKRLKPIQYESPDRSVFVNVLPHQDFGMATIWDADVLIWATSTLHEMKRKGVNDLPRTLDFQPYDLLRAIGRQTGGNRYAALRESLSRLQTTTINTNIRVPKAKKFHQFSWIDAWSDLTNEEGTHSQGMSITLSEWFYEGVVMDGGVLAIEPAYFRITGGRERWLYRVARKHAGGRGREGFTIGMETLFDKAGAEGTFRRFKHEIAKIARENTLPSFDLHYVETRGKASLAMGRRDLSDATDLLMAVDADGEGLKAKARSKATRIDQLTDETVAMVRRDFPGWDVYALKSSFDDWLNGSSKNQVPADYQRAFYGFVRTSTRQKRS